MMYRISRKTNVLRRPDWMIRLLFAISPKSYVVGTKKEVKKSLSFLHRQIKRLHFWKRNGKFTLCQTENEVSIVNSKGRVYVSFHVEAV